MEGTVQRKILLGQLDSYLSILADKGIAIDIPERPELEKMSPSDLARIVRLVRDLARTPIS